MAVRAAAAKVAVRAAAAAAKVAVRAAAKGAVKAVKAAAAKVVRAAAKVVRAAAKVAIRAAAKVVAAKVVRRNKDAEVPLSLGRAFAPLTTTYMEEMICLEHPFSQYF